MTSAIRKFNATFGPDMAGPVIAFIAVILVFGLSADNFISMGTFGSVAFQLPELGLLTLAMLLPLLTGGINLSVTFAANLSGLAAAWVLQAHGGVDAPPSSFFFACLAALTVGGAAGAMTGAAIAYTSAHPILVTLSMMIFLRGLGEFLTRGGDVSGFPSYMAPIGHGSFFGLPIPLLIFIVCVALWQLLLTRSKLGFGLLMIGSNIEAARYSGLNTRKIQILVYTLSGLMCAVAGIIMLARFNSVRVGHGESYLLITVLAAFLGGINPFGGFGRVLPVFVALIVLQLLSSGLNLLGANQHLATALWGVLMIVVMAARTIVSNYTAYRRKKA
ncbi:ABC transporter permease [Agrobacterium larrymoorei]|uniref:ABC transporter permease n=1 Tax=Agrobacterium larrymoorei TaxID=160699 RepID=A0A4D7DUX7_9HYPH|nr:ABC transporter permease [Agrobacterium larrymoorei]QCJ00832.1 ABC transporter permease [Agrobacterium larrymoorei]QYA10497.1 ABC transporter permease [Agrobacterium larrymoorei]